MDTTEKKSSAVKNPKDGADPGAPPEHNFEGRNKSPEALANPSSTASGDPYTGDPFTPSGEMLKLLAVAIKTGRTDPKAKSWANEYCKRAGIEQ